VIEIGQWMSICNDVYSTFIREKFAKICSSDYFFIRVRCAKRYRRGDRWQWGFFSVPSISHFYDLINKTKQIFETFNRIENLSKASYSDVISSDTLILLFYKNILSDDLYNDNMSNYNKQYSKKKGYFNKEEIV